MAFQSWNFGCAHVSRARPVHGCCTSHEQSSLAACCVTSKQSDWWNTAVGTAFIQQEFVAHSQSLPPSHLVAEDGCTRDLCQSVCMCVCVCVSVQWGLFSHDWWWSVTALFSSLPVGRRLTSATSCHRVSFRGCPGQRIAWSTTSICCVTSGDRTRS